MDYHVHNGPLMENMSSLKYSSVEYNDKWLKAEAQAEGLISCIKPSRSSEERRRDVIKYVEHLIERRFGCKVFPFGSVPLKTYLPNGDIDLTAIRELCPSNDSWAQDVCALLEKEEQCHSSQFQVKEVKCIHAEVPVVKCLVADIIVDISFNQLGGLSTLCFLEEVDRLIGKNHLFKRSIILIKAWCFYESRILGAHHGLLSTYALETLVLYIFHVFHDTLRGPLEVLFQFLQFFSKFDWNHYCLSLWGPIPISSVHNIGEAVESLQNSNNQNLLSEAFLKDCREKYSTYSEAIQGKPFHRKFMNVVDPLRLYNNLGRSVNRGNFVRIHSAFTYGAIQMEKLLQGSDEHFANNFTVFFRNTQRHCRGHRPDACSLSDQSQPKPYVTVCSDQARGTPTNLNIFHGHQSMNRTSPNEEHIGSHMQISGAIRLNNFEMDFCRPLTDETESTLTTPGSSSPKMLTSTPVDHCDQIVKLNKSAEHSHSLQLSTETDLTSKRAQHINDCQKTVSGWDHCSCALECEVETSRQQKGRAGKVNDTWCCCRLEKASHDSEVQVRDFPEDGIHKYAEQKPDLCSSVPSNCSYLKSEKVVELGKDRAVNCPVDKLEEDKLEEDKDEEQTQYLSPPNMIATDLNSHDPETAPLLSMTDINSNSRSVTDVITTGSYQAKGQSKDRVDTPTEALAGFFQVLELTEAEAQADILRGDFASQLHNLEVGRHLQNSSSQRGLLSASLGMIHPRHTEWGSPWEGPGRPTVLSGDFFAQFSGYRNGANSISPHGRVDPQSRSHMPNGILPESFAKFHKGTGTFFPNLKSGYERERRFGNVGRSQRKPSNMDIAGQNGTIPFRSRAHGPKRREGHGKFKSRNTLEPRSGDKEWDMATEDSSHADIPLVSTEMATNFPQLLNVDSLISSNVGFSRADWPMMSPTSNSKSLSLENLEFGSFGPGILTGNLQDVHPEPENAGSGIQTQQNTPPAESLESPKHSSRSTNDSDSHSSPRSSYQLKDEDFPPLTFQQETSGAFTAHKVQTQQLSYHQACLIGHPA